MWKLLVGWQVGNLAYGPVGSGAMRSGQQANRNLSLEEPDGDSTSCGDLLITKLLPAILLKWPTQD